MKKKCAAWRSTCDGAMKDLHLMKNITAKKIQQYGKQVFCGSKVSAPIPLDLVIVIFGREKPVFRNTGNFLCAAFCH